MARRSSRSDRLEAERKVARHERERQRLERKRAKAGRREARRADRDQPPEARA